MATLEVTKEPVDTRSLHDSYDGISAVMEIITHDGKSVKVEVTLFQEADHPPTLQIQQMSRGEYMTEGDRIWEHELEGVDQ